MNQLKNLLMFQVGWWGAVLLINAGSNYLAFMLLLLLGLTHLFLFSKNGETEFVVKTTLIGYLSDAFLSYFNFIFFKPMLAGFPHVWLLGIWFLMSCTLLHSLQWVLDKRGSGIIMSMIMGPLTYFFVARKYDFIIYPQNLENSLLVQSIIWGVVIYQFQKLKPTGLAMIHLKDRHILITGASRGIGEALARELCSHSPVLHLVGRSLDEKLIGELKNLGAKDVILHKHNLSQPKEVDRLVEELSHVPLDMVINNAGQLTGGLLEDQPVDKIEEMLKLNVNSLIRLTRLLLPRLLKQRKGVIINNASVSAKMFFPCASTYAASKAAVAAFTHSLSQELRGTGVSAHLMITPGVKTKMFDDISDLYGGHLDLSFMDSIPASRWAQRVIEGVESGKEVIWPYGASYLGVKFAHHFPVLFEKIVKTKFKR